MFEAWFELALAFLLCSFIAERYLAWRQRQCFYRNEVPARLKDHLEVEDLKKANEYSLDRSLFSLVHGCFDVVQDVLFMFFLPVVWNFCRVGDSEIANSLVFVLVVALAGIVLELPWELYGTFVIEQRHGFNKTTARLFIVDKVKTFLISAAIGGPLLSLIIFIVRFFGETFVFYLLVFIIVAQFGLFLLLGDTIMKCFNTYKNLEGPLLVAVQELCNRYNYNIQEAYVVDGSTRSSHSNAYFLSVLWKKKLVIYDTLLKNSEGEVTEERDVMAVVAHELSHWRYNHVNKLMVIQIVLTFCQFQLLSLCMFNAGLFRAFGFVSEMPVVVGMLLFSKLIVPLDFFIEIGVNAISRRFEFQADQGAVELGFDNIGSALITLSRENKDSCHKDWLYSMCTLTHPTLLERLDAIDKLQKKKK